MAVDRIKQVARLLPGVAELEPFVVHQGFLEKRGNQQLKAKDWQPRGCVGTQVGLYYFRQRASSSAAGHIPFCSTTEVGGTTGSDRPFVFQIRSPAGRIYYFQALDSNELNMWVNILSESALAACQSHAETEKGSSSSSASFSTMPTSTASQPPAFEDEDIPSSKLSSPQSAEGMANNDGTSTGLKVVKAGFLRKQGAQVKSWKRRWFVLTEGSLAYYRSPGEGEAPLGTINVMLSAVKVPMDAASAKKHSFEVITSARTYFIQAEDRASLENWVEKIRVCISDSISGRKTVNLFGHTPNLAKQHLREVVMRAPGNT